MRFREAGLALGLALALGSSFKIANAQNPAASYRTITSKHFRVIYETGLDSLAIHAAQRAELEHARLSAGLINAPKGKIDIIVADNTDITNGQATPFTFNHLVIWARPPVEELSLQNYDDWIDLVVTHELTHIFHLDQTGKFGRALRKVFGRLPGPWPFFPVVELPGWNLEGLAVLIESQHTGSGRNEGSYHEMVVRTGILEHEFDTIDRVSGQTPIWPGGVRAYIYGSLFMDYIARNYGEKAHTELIRKTAGSILPPSWRMDGIAKKAIGKTYTQLYKEWRTQLEQQYTALSDSLRKTGLTRGETVTTTGRWALHPLISPDNKLLAYNDENGRDATATRIVDLTTGTDQRYRRNGFGPVAWFPNSRDYITAQYQFEGPNRIYSDLFVVRDGVEQQLTKGERVESPDVSADGERVVYVQNTRGTNRLMTRDMASGQATVLVAASPDAQWILPRFSSDGTRIAIQRWSRAHGHDVVILDAHSGDVVRVIATGGTDGAPTWSPDGRWIVFSSDRTGIANLYVANSSTGDIKQVTNVLTGAFYPDVSPDGKWIYYSGYHGDGFHIERLPFAANTWREPLPEASPAALRPDTIKPATPTTPVDTRTSASHKYSPVPALLPKFWLPTAFGDDSLGYFFGVVVAGIDDVDRHQYFGQIAYDFEHKRVAGNIDYTYAGFSNPVLDISLNRDWDYTGHVSVRKSDSTIATYKSYQREDRVELSARFSLPRWRQSAAATLSVEGVELNRGVLGAARFRDPQDKLLGVIAGVGFANYRVPSYAISREDGMRASGYVRRRFDMSPSDISDASYTELVGSAAAYKSLSLFGFSHHAVAVRANALRRTRTAGGPEDVGGPFGFLPVRGFHDNERTGFTGWIASAEYRLPIALIGRGWRVHPLFLDRVSASAFVDAGNASCTAEQRALYISCPGTTTSPRTDMLLSGGFEVSANAAAFSFYPVWVRLGVGWPLQGAQTEARGYIAIGQSF